MPVLALGLALFLGTHIFTMFRDSRARLVERFGEASYKVTYSVLAALGLVLIGVGYGEYRQDDWIDVWFPPVWAKHLALPMVWAALVLLVAAYLPGRIKARVKHPMLLAVKLWATAHLISNGDLGSMLMFGAILAWAVAARISVKRRDEVQPHGGEAAPSRTRNDLVAVVTATAAYAAIAFWLHPQVIGVPIWPAPGGEQPHAQQPQAQQHSAPAAAPPRVEAAPLAKPGAL